MQGDSELWICTTHASVKFSTTCRRCKDEVAHAEPNNPDKGNIHVSFVQFVHNLSTCFEWGQTHRQVYVFRNAHLQERMVQNSWMQTNCLIHEWSKFWHHSDVGIRNGSARQNINKDAGDEVWCAKRGCVTTSKNCLTHDIVWLLGCAGIVW